MRRGRFEEETSPKRRLSLLRGGERPSEEGGMQQRVVKTHTSSPKSNQKRGTMLLQRNKPSGQERDCRGSSRQQAVGGGGGGRGRKQSTLSPCLSLALSLLRASQQTDG